MSKAMSSSPFALDNILEDTNLAIAKGCDMDAITPTDLKTMRKHANRATAMLRTLTHEARLLVLCELVGGERSAGELVERSGLSQSALSQHLARLRDEGLVATRRESQTIYYRIADPNAARVLGTLRDIYCRKWPWPFPRSRRQKPISAL